MQNGVTAVDDIKRSVRIVNLGAVPNFKLDGALSANRSLKGKGYHIYRQVNAYNFGIEFLSHVEIATSDSTSHIQDTLSGLQVQHIYKFLGSLCDVNIPQVSSEFLKKKLPLLIAKKRVRIDRKSR
jgi:hypothetical protein